MDDICGDVTAAPTNYLILDQGGSSSRAMIFTAEGKLLCSSQQAVATIHPAIARVEQIPDDVIASIISVGRQALSQLDPRQRNLVQSCGLVTQRSSIVCWDKHTGSALSPILSWQDTRASAWLAEQELDIDEIHSLTGLIPNAHFGASKMRWCLDHLLPVQEAAQQQRLCMAPLASYLAFKLLESSPFVVDPANASRTMLMNIGSGDWDSSLLSDFRIKPEWLPKIVATTENFGDINWGGLEDKVIPLALINGDQSAATYSAGMPKSTNFYMNIGTGGFVYRTINRPVPKSLLLSSIVFWGDKALAPEYVLEGTVNGVGSALHWYAKQIKVDDINEWIIQRLVQLDRKWPRSLPLFLNGIGGLGSPDWQADFPVKFIGQGDDLENFAAIIESIIFLLYRNFLLLNAVGKTKNQQRIIISGGLSQSDSICQALSDLSDCKVIRPNNPEASARGAAFLLSGRHGEWQVLDEAIFFPTANQGESALNIRFRKWTEIMEKELSRLK
jgi:glycerol kinase